MKIQIIIATFFWTFMAYGQSEVRTKYSINSNWHFLKNSSGVKYMSSLPDSAWQKVNIPHVWNKEAAFDDEPGFDQGTAWYKKELFVNQSGPGKRVFLYFEAVNQIAELYINNQFAGKHFGGYSAFSFDITPYLSKESNKNSILLKVNNEYHPDVPPHGRNFTFFGGIYRDVYLITTHTIHFDVTNLASDGVFVSTPVVTSNEAIVEVKGDILNHTSNKQTLTVQSIIRDRENKEITRFKTYIKAGKNGKVHFDIKSSTIKNPILWSPENPYLYSVCIQIIDEEENMVDEVTCPLGFRFFHFDADKGFFLNGKPCKLVGTSRHQDYHYMGTAVPNELHYSDLKMIKDMGMNFLRVSHYPHDPAIMQACDELGLLNVVEIPLINLVIKTKSFFEVSANMQREMIRQNYNHPSTIMWAYMNEIQFTPPGGFKDYSLYTDEELVYFKNTNELAQLLEDISREEDPYRFTNIPNAGNFERFPVAVQSGITDIPQVVGWNLYNGWYFEDVTKFDEYVDSLHRVQLKDKPFFVTEYGAGSDIRIRSEKPERFDFSIEWQNHFHEHHLQAILKRPYVTASAVWNFADFSLESAKEAIQHFNTKGLVTSDRLPKDLYFYHKAVLNDEPMIKIAPLHYEKRAGMQANSNDDFCEKEIWVYSNVEELSLYFNGKLIENRDVSSSKEVFILPFKNGKNTIEAVAPTESGNIKDFQVVEFTLYPKKLTNDNMPRAINVNLGSTFYFTDDFGTLWLPDKPYEKGNWGYQGGNEIRRVSWIGNLMGVDDNILRTDQEPLYQTQRLNFDAYQFDVPNGNYDIILYFSDLLTENNIKNLPGTLKNVEGIDKNAVFDIVINDRVIHEALDMKREHGELSAVKYQYEIAVRENKGITIQLDNSSGVGMLNAIRVLKKK